MGRNAVLYHLAAADGPHLAVSARLGKRHIGALHANRGYVDLGRRNGQRCGPGSWFSMENQF